MVKTIVLDLDGTLTQEGSGSSYNDVLPRWDIVKCLKEYSANGYRIAIYTSRNMRTYANSVGMINANTIPIIVSWLRRYEIPFDELHVGKPWCDEGGFYVDDKAIRPSELLKLSESEIMSLLSRERKQ